MNNLEAYPDNIEAMFVVFCMTSGYMLYRKYRSIKAERAKHSYPISERNKR